MRQSLKRRSRRARPRVRISLAPAKSLLRTWFALSGVQRTTTWLGRGPWGRAGGAAAVSVAKPRGEARADKGSTSRSAMLTKSCGPFVSRVRRHSRPPTPRHPATEMKTGKRAAVPVTSIAALSTKQPARGPAHLIAGRQNGPQALSAPARHLAGRDDLRLVLDREIH
jgi:hypothetical protein